MKMKWSLSVILLVLIFGCSDSKDLTQTKNEHQNKEVLSEPKEAVQNVKKPVNETADQASAGEASIQNKFNLFYVFADKGSRVNHFIPSGFMPTGECIVFNDRFTELCHKGSTCIKINYDVECSRKGQRWAGVYWLNPANNWGSRKGGFNLNGASKLTFWAKGDLGGEQIQEFTIGGISGDYPDSDKIVIGPVILSNQWKQYTMDLRGKDLSYISGGFSWSTSEEVNPESCTFYLDEIRFE